jgi:hypothetical protein
MDPWTGHRGPDLRTVDLFHRFFQLKNNSIIQKIHRSPGILQNTPELFQNYILVPKKLHLGPCRSFYIYKYLPFVFILIYFISFLTY